MKWDGNPSRGPVGTPTVTFTTFLPVIVGGSVDSPPPTDDPVNFYSILVTDSQAIAQINSGSATHQGSGVWRFTGNANAGATLEPAWNVLGMQESSAALFNALNGYEWTVKGVSGVGSPEFAAQTTVGIMHPAVRNLQSRINVKNRGWRTGAPSQVGAWGSLAPSSVGPLDVSGNDNDKLYFLQWGGTGSYQADIELRVLWASAYML